MALVSVAALCVLVTAQLNSTTIPTASDATPEGQRQKSVCAFCELFDEITGKPCVAARVCKFLCISMFLVLRM